VSRTKKIKVTDSQFFRRASRNRRSVAISGCLSELRLHHGLLFHNQISHYGVTGSMR